jgi:diaminopimelate decarboxylase
MNIKDLFEQYGSPLYVYDLNELRVSYQKLRDSLPNESILYYSLKANPYTRLVKEFVKLGCKCEISSINELKSALEAGAEAEEILFTGPAKSIQEIEQAIRLGVGIVSCESWNELIKLVKISEKYQRKVKVIIRVNPNNRNLRSSLSMTGVSSQFGIDEEDIVSIPSDALKSKYIELIGFHVFNGTNSTDIKSIILSFTYSILMAKRLSKMLNLNLKFLDLGGGFGHPFAKKDDSTDFKFINKALSEVLDKELPQWRIGDPIISFESGRYLVASCGKYICRVEDIKLSKGNQFVLLDGGINHLGGMSGLGRMQKFDIDFELESEQKLDENIEASMVGPLCTPLDLMRRNKETQKLSINDIVIVPNVGAYGLSASLLGFLSRDTPCEIIVDHHSIVEVTQLKLKRKTLTISNKIIN